MNQVNIFLKDAPLKVKIIQAHAYFFYVNIIDRNTPSKTKTKWLFK